MHNYPIPTFLSIHTVRQQHHWMTLLKKSLHFHEDKQTVPNHPVPCLEAGIQFILYYHVLVYLELQCAPVEHIPWSELKLGHVFLDLAGWEDVVPHVDVRHHADKGLLGVKPSAVAVLLLERSSDCELSLLKVQSVQLGLIYFFYIGKSWKNASNKT